MIVGHRNRTRTTMLEAFESRVVNSMNILFLPGLTIHFLFFTIAVTQMLFLVKFLFSSYYGGE